MADFCRDCEIEMFDDTYLNLDDDDIILCEGCGCLKPYDNSYRFKRYWTNHCEHENYICSYSFTDFCDVKGKRELREIHIGMYIYEECDRTEICLRYGEKPEQYMSNGEISYLCQSKIPLKKRAVEILKILGDITWVRK